MNDAQPTRSPDVADDLTTIQTSRLLRLATAEAHKPVNRLIARLREPDGQEWFRSACVSLAQRPGSVPASTLLEGPVELVVLESFKDACKRAASHPLGHEEGLVEALGYFLAVAAALTQHGRFISKRSREEVNRVLEEMAGVLPPEWATMFLTAAKARA